MDRIDELRRINLDAESKRFGGDAALAEKIGKDANQVYQWLRAKPLRGRNISTKIARAIEPMLERPQRWLDEDHAAESGRELDEAIYASQPYSRIASDIDQLRALVLSMLDVIAARQSGVAAALHERMQAVPKDFDEAVGFHARVVGILRTIRDTEEAVRNSALRLAGPQPSGKKRVP